MKKIIKLNKNFIVKKSENLVTARYKLNPLAIKFLTTIISSLKENDDINKEYIFKVKEFQELTKINTKRIYEYVELALDNLLNNPLKIPLNKEQTKFLKVNWISSAVYDNGEISFLIDKRLKPYLLEVKEKFLKYKLENILHLKSSYSIRLYEILKDKFETFNRYRTKTEKKFKLDELREVLEIPKSYRFNNIKIQVLEKAKKELKENTDIFFEYEVIKKGRKVDEIKFIIFKNSDKLEIEEPAIIQEKVIKKEKKEISNNWNDWRKKLLKQGNLIIFLENEIFKIKNGYLFKNDKLLSSEKSLEIWQTLYENRNKLKIMDEEEYIQEQIKKAEEQEKKYKKLKQLRKKYDNKTIFGQPNKQKPTSEFKIEAIQFYENSDENIALYLIDNHTNENSITLFQDINLLEKFLETSLQNYLNKNNQNDNLINKIKNLKNKYTNSKLLIEIDENETIEAKVLNIKFDEKSVELYLKIDNEKSIEPFKLNNEEIRRLEKFLKICNDVYLKTQQKKIKSKLSSVIKRF